MPVFNREELAPRAIRSILAQDFADFEFIIVDDGSTDGTAEAVRAFEDPRIRMAQMPVNCGIAMARNAGVNLARGEFIATMDSDDVSLPGRLGRQLEFLGANPEIDILGCNCVRVAGDARQSLVHAADDDMIKARLLRLNGASLFEPTTMIRASFLQRTQTRYPVVRTDSDHGFYIEAMVRGAKFAVLQETLFEYHRHDGNITSSDPEKLADHRRRKTPMRARLIGLFFPQIDHEEANAIAVWMEEGRRHSVVDAAMAVAAIRNASRDNRSYFGESRAELGHILREHASRALKALTRAG